VGVQVQLGFTMRLKHARSSLALRSTSAAHVIVQGQVDGDEENSPQPAIWKQMATNGPKRDLGEYIIQLAARHHRTYLPRRSTKTRQQIATLLHSIGYPLHRSHSGDDADRPPRPYVSNSSARHGHHRGQLAMLNRSICAGHQ